MGTRLNCLLIFHKQSQYPTIPNYTQQQIIVINQSYGRYYEDVTMFNFDKIKLIISTSNNQTEAQKSGQAHLTHQSYLDELM